MRELSYGLLVAAVASLLTACGGPAGSGSRSTEDRINEAVPLSEELRGARDALEKLLANDLQKLARVKAELDARLKVRALSCAGGYSPSALESDENVRKHLTDTNCFANADAELLTVVNHYRLAALIHAGPLRPVPKDPPKFITASGRLSEVMFADAAGVALVGTPNALEAVDLSNSQVLSSQPRINAYQVIEAVSPNGQIFIAETIDHATHLRATEGGALLESLPGRRLPVFVDDDLLLLTDLGGGGPVLRDLNSGNEKKLPGVDEAYTSAFALGGKTDPTFFLCTRTTLLQLKVKRTAAGPETEILNQAPLEGCPNITRRTPTVMGERVVAYSRKALMLTSLDTFQTEAVPFEPLMVGSIVRMPEDGDVLLNLTGPAVPDFGQRWMRMSLEHRTIGLVSKDVTGSYVFVKPLDRLAWMSGSRIELLEHSPEPEMKSLDAFVAQAAAQSRAAIPGAYERQLAAIDPANDHSTPYMMARQYGIPQDVRPPPEDLHLPPSARVVALGVYEPKPRGSAITVRLTRSAGIVVLVLTSYESVIWHLQVEPGAQTPLILLSGYNESSVYGANAAKLRQLGRNFAYVRGSSEYVRLDAAVFQLIGRKIDSFQGSYKASTFVVTD